jgi:hypothetical protein
LNSADIVQVKQYIEWHKQYNNKHTTTFVVNQSYDSNKPKNTWFTDTEFLTGLIPLETDSFCTIQQIKKIKNNSIDALFENAPQMSAFEINNATKENLPIHYLKS